MSLTDSISPNDLQAEIQRGVKRLNAFARFRVQSLRQYAGSHYDKHGEEVGAEPLNMMFNAVRVMVPNLVMNFPTHILTSPYMQAKDYANLLGLALEQHDKKINIRDTYRRVIVDALFAIGVLKTGLAQGDSVYAIDDEQQIASGEIYTEAVDFDDWVVDPKCKEHLFRDARFMGHKLIVPRKMLLDSGLYNNEYVEKLPTAYSTPNTRDKAARLSMRNIMPEELSDFEDDVAIYEIWVPSANAIVTVPAEDTTKFDDYLRVADYYGVKEGPYTLLTFTPAVPGNPLPVPLTSVWYDLHVCANMMAKKIIDQAQRQKSIYAYKRSASDDADELRTAADGEGVAVDDPSAVVPINLGGQLNSNETHLAQLMNWFNLMAANPEQIGGQQVQANSATAASILQQNANVGLSDMKDMVYIMAAEEARKRAWYFHTDPMMKIPLTQRQKMPPQLIQGPMGNMIIQPPTEQEVQVILTPEARSGDFVDFTFKIAPESLGRLDSKVRLQQLMQFATQTMPAVMTAAQVAMGLGIPFNAVGFLLKVGKDMGIDDLDQIVFDPQYMQQQMLQQSLGPQMADSKGQVAGMPNPGLNNSIAQNGQPGQVQGTPPNAAMEQKQAQQAGAADAQRMTRLALGHALAPPPAGNKASQAMNVNSF